MRNEFLLGPLFFQLIQLVSGNGESLNSDGSSTNVTNSTTGVPDNSSRNLGDMAIPISILSIIGIVILCSCFCKCKELCEQKTGNRHPRNRDPGIPIPTYAATISTVRDDTTRARLLGDDLEFRPITP